MKILPTGLSCVLLALGTARASLNDYDGVISAEATAGRMPTAKLINAVTFNGGNSSAFNFGAVSGDGTFEFIVEGSPSTANGYLAVGSNSTSNLRFEQYPDTGLLGMTQLGVADYLFTPGVPTPTTVKHITYAWNGAGTMKLYVDGVLAGTNSSMTSSFGLPAGSGRLGANPSNGEGMVGTIYRLTCYNSLLSEADILRHADAFRGILRPPVIQSFTSTPVSVAAGEQVTLTWSLTGAQSVTLNGADVTGQSQAVFTVSGTTTYTLAASNANGTTTLTREVTVIQPANHVVINEFMAENKSALADEDGDFSDWLELHNPTSAPVDLTGHYLTDNASALQKWALPPAVLAPGEYRVVFLSSKDRKPVTGQWHTNFKLSKDGEYLALTGPAGVIQEFAPVFPPQDENVSYGLSGADVTVSGFMAHATPGAANDPTPPQPARVKFSNAPGILTTPFSLALTSATPGASVYYRMNNGVAILYTAPLNIAASTQVTAWAERYGQKSPMTRGTWMKLAADMTNYTSPLPVMVIDNFAAGPIPQKGWSGNGAGITQVPKQAAAWAMWDRAAGSATTLTGAPQMTSQIGIRGRGAFSSSWRQKPYAVEAWSADGSNEDVSVLGMPAHSDWILYFPDPDTNKDPTLLFSTFMYQLAREAGHDAPRFRWVELFVNEDGGDLALTDRRGVYAVLEKPTRGKHRIDFDKLSEDGKTGGWITNINRMDAAPETGFPAANGATSPQFFRTAGPNRLLQTTPNNPANSGDDIPVQSNGFLNFDTPNGYSINATQRAAIEGWYKTFEDTLYNNSVWRDPVNGYRKWLDDRDFAEYFIFNTLSHNGDGMLISMYPWKGNDGRLRMGPAWDYNWSSYYVGGAYNVDLRWRSEQLWYPRLFADPDFAQLYIDRWFAFRRGPMSNARMSAIVDAQAAEITYAKAVQQGIAGAADYAGRLTSMKTWLSMRADWVDSNYIRPPVFSVTPGIVSAGQTVALSAPSGVIYRTLNGVDPRFMGGSIAPGAAVGNTVGITADTKITARVQGSPSWSAPSVGVYVTDAVPATAANLAIAEIHYHPGEATSGEREAGFTNAEDFEFIELLNFSAQKVSLAGLRFVAGDTGGGVGFEFNEGGIWSLSPGSRVVVVKSRVAFTQRYGPSIPVAGEYKGRLDNAGDTLTLVNAAGTVLSAVTYNDKGLWPSAADGDGYSLTFMAPGGNPADPANWRTSITTGGSPGTGDGTVYSGGDLLAYALGAYEPVWTASGDNLVVSQRRMPGSDAALVTLEYSSDLATWTPATPSVTAETRPDDGGFTTRWTIPGGLRQFVRLRVSVR